MPLVDVDPELMRFLSEEERAAVGELRLAVRTIMVSGPDVQSQLERDKAFGAFVLDGLVAHEIRLGDRLGVRLLGPGDLIVWRYGPPPLILTASGWRAASPLRLALFRNHMLATLQRSPRLMAGMYLRVGQQLDRLAAQLMLCQLPRVEDRVLGLMWLMAESWGRVTSAGTRLSLDVTHELIGMMIGARRPTVTLALRELADRGAMIRQDDGWLLLERPPGASDAVTLQSEASDLLRPGGTTLTLVPEPSESSDLGAPDTDPSDIVASYAALLEALARLRKHHERSMAGFDQRIQDVRATRERCRRTRLELSRDRNNRIRPVPS